MIFGEDRGSITSKNILHFIGPEPKVCIIVWLL